MNFTKKSAAYFLPVLEIFTNYRRGNYLKVHVDNVISDLQRKPESISEDDMLDFIDDIIKETELILEITWEEIVEEIIDEYNPLPYADGVDKFIEYTLYNLNFEGNFVNNIQEDIVDVFLETSPEKFYRIAQEIGDIVRVELELAFEEDQ